MKMYVFVSVLSIISFVSKSYAQVADSLSSKIKKDKIKKGWNVGAVPAIAFESDLGFKYGAIANIYNYGDGSAYPRYMHSIYLEWTRTTKGSGQNQIIYDSEYLIPGVRLTAEANILTERALDFYGFNGYEAYYSPDIEDSVSSVYFRQERRITRFKFDFQGRIKDRTLRWYAGFTYLNYKIDSVDIDKLNKGKDEADKLPNTPSLYSKYLKWGLIPENQKNGGNTNLLTCGLVYDTRDNEPNPMKGIWSEAMLISSPSFLGNKFPYAKIVLTHRQYFTIKKDIINTAIRLSYQGKFGGGTIPFYMLPYVYTPRQPRDGMGGAKTLRGILRNRIVGEGFVFGNIEVRWKFLRTIIYNQNIYAALAPFFDFGKITGKYKIDTSVLTQEAINYLAGGTIEKWHSSYGAGLYFAMNQNFIISFCYGLAANKNDGKSGLYIALDFLY